MRFLTAALAFVLAACISTGPVQPLPEDGLFARVMPRVFANSFASGNGRLGAGAEVFVTAARDLDGVATASEAQRRLTLYLDYAATQPNLTGDAVIRFRLRDRAKAGLRVPGRLIADSRTGRRTPRGYGFKPGGRTAGGAREWILRNGTAQDLGAYDVSVRALQP